MRREFFEKITYDDGTTATSKVSEFYSDLTSGFPRGATLVIVDESWTKRRYDVDPRFIELAAAGAAMEEELFTILLAHTKLKPAKEMTPECAELWKKMIEVDGESMMSMSFSSIHGIIESLIAAIVARAAETSDSPAIVDIREKYFLMAKLANQHKDNSNGL